MKVLTFLFFTIFSFENIAAGMTDEYFIIQKVELSDERILTAISDYIREEDLGNVEGAVVLQYHHHEMDTFYLGYVVYISSVDNNPPSHYAKVNGKLVLIYTGLERYLKYDKSSFSKLEKEAKTSFPREGGIIVEPVYWKLILTNVSYRKEIVNRLGSY